MRRLVFIFIVLPLIIGMTNEPGNAQKRRRRARTRTQAVKSSQVSESTDPSSSEENDRISESCSLADRPKPEVEVRMALACGKAVSLPKPPYPEEAKAAHVYGTVTVEVVVDEKGRVIWAQAVDGDPLLLKASVMAACRARFSPIKISGRAVKASGVMTYNFVGQ